MKQVIIVYLPWLLSAITIWMTLAQGNKKAHAWIIGLFGQLGWSTWILTSETLGLLPLNVVLWVLYARNHYLWNELKIYRWRNSRRARYFILMATREKFIPKHFNCRCVIDPRTIHHEYE